MTPLERLMRRPQTDIVGYAYVKEHSNPRLSIWSYKKGKLYRLSAQRPSLIKVKGRMFRTNPENWEELDSQPPNIYIIQKTFGSKKIYWLKEG